MSLNLEAIIALLCFSLTLFVQSVLMSNFISLKMQFVPYEPFKLQREIAKFYMSKVKIEARLIVIKHGIHTRLH